LIVENVPVVVPVLYSAARRRPVTAIRPAPLSRNRRSAFPTIDDCQDQLFQTTRLVEQRLRQSVSAGNSGWFQTLLSALHLRRQPTPDQPASGNS
jgi:hypothetical protein